MSPRRSLQRPSGFRSYGSRVLIACEGKATERGYFEDLRISRRLPTLQVIVLDPSCTDPLSIVQAVDDHRESLRRQRRWDRSDTAWAVFDGDEHRNNDPDRWHRALQVARSRNVSLAVSNPCFELWYLLHHQEQGGYLTREQARASLRRHHPEYEKNSRLYQALAPSLDEAVRRAQALAARAAAVGDDPYLNPTTGVGKLVIHLRDLKSSRP